MSTTVPKRNRTLTASKNWGETASDKPAVSHSGRPLTSEEPIPAPEELHTAARPKAAFFNVEESSVDQADIPIVVTDCTPAPIAPQPSASVPAEKVSVAEAKPSVPHASPTKPGLVNIDVYRKEYEDILSANVKALYAGLREEALETEDTIAAGEQELIQKMDFEFFKAQHKIAVANMVAAHSKILHSEKALLEAELVARRERKLAKRENRKAVRGSKNRDMVILKQKKAAESFNMVQQTATEKRLAFDALIAHTYEKHEKQRKDLMHSQERKYRNEKMFVELETRHLKPELRSTILKKFQVRQNHVAQVSKHINDNLREFQLMELRHVKEKFELELMSFEEASNKTIQHEVQLSDLKLR
ncbi:hypothetical protein HDV03_000064 [Kappamyces sp. JEL0829]|nr:hypothetical protein HDV03_000064 [Kappamyces sp. JEL0829]